MESDIDSQVSHNVSNRGERQYNETYEDAVDLMAKGKGASEIEAALNQEPALRNDNPVGNRELKKQVSISNRTERLMAEIRATAIVDAVLGKPKKYNKPNGY